MVRTIGFFVCYRGGYRTLDGAEAVQVMHQLKPTITIPMHYRTKALGIPGMILFDKVDKFLNASGQHVEDVSELHITKEGLNDYKGIVTFQYQ
ncbi:hypothetical protein [Paenibacillus pinihumi]|uniref:hypothetical protein n=1 Tax=Paenibacillus pinihumi TaxID=669462 RepID=UPI0006888D15|nr:hypothetical protein [Paenibacillus pinihumi]